MAEIRGIGLGRDMPITPTHRRPLSRAGCLTRGKPADRAFAALVYALALVLASSAFADMGGAGGNDGSGGIGGVGGADTNPPSNGADGSGNAGGGGGGAGTGVGGTSDGTGGVGGAGGGNGAIVTMTSTSSLNHVGSLGGNGGTAVGSGGGGGGGQGGDGAFVTGAGITYTVNGSDRGNTGGVGGNGAGGSGGNGGDGGNGEVVSGAGTTIIVGTNGHGIVAGGSGGVGGAASGSGAGGNGGAGSAGITVTASDVAILVGTGTSSFVLGGSGGDGGGASGSGNGGNGGVGGAGIVVTASDATIIDLPGSLIDGNSGGGAGSGVANGAPGAAGVGIIGAGITIVDGGSIAGGLFLGGVARADAIVFTGGTNSLTLEAGYSITGDVVAFSNADMLALGGSANASFNVSNISAASSSAQYQGFGGFQKTGASIWTLTGTPGIATNWMITGGLLNFNSANNFGGGTIALNGGGLQWATGNAIDISGQLAPLGPNGGIFDTNGNSVTLGSALTGAGGITKQGAGALTLSGTNTYSGPTSVMSGALTAGSPGGFSPLSAYTVAAGTMLDIDANVTIGSLAGAGLVEDDNTTAHTLTTGTNNLSTTFAGTIADGAGQMILVKTGSGTLVLDGNSTYTGGTTVSAGALEIGDVSTAGASLSGDVSVDAAAALTGHGTIGGTLTNAGTVMPGGASMPAVGALTVGGNYTQSAGGALTIAVTPGGAAKLAVGGAAALAGTLALDFAPGTYAPGSAYTLLTASSLAGTFSTVTGANPSELPQAILYESDPSVVLRLGYGGTFAPTNDTVYSAATSIAILNAQQVNGIILDRIGQRQAGIADGEIGVLTPSGLSPAQLAQAGGNGATLGEVAAALPQALSMQGAWFRGIGGFASVNGNSSTPGFSGATGGFLAGYDRSIAPNLYLGVAGGYLHSDIDEHSTSSGTEGSARIAVYGGFVAGDNLFSATAGYANDRFVTNRGLTGVGTANESHSGNEATVAGQWSLPLTIAGLGGGLATLTPKAGIQYLHLSEEAFGETGAGGFDLSNSGHGTDSLQPFVGAALAQKFITDDGLRIIPELRLGYAHEAFDSRLLTVTSAGGEAFLVEGLRPSRDQLTAGFGLIVQIGPNLSAYGDYDAILHTGNTDEQTIQVGLHFKF